jgi:predicted RNA-binding Zn-ribbon protein involved in translation (DUF1610 family)
MSGRPFECPQCGQLGTERPGFARGGAAVEAVGFAGDDGMTMVESFTCLRCGRVAVVPVGAVEVRKMPADSAG